jgi:hypothetical protein
MARDILHRPAVRVALLAIGFLASAAIALVGPAAALTQAPEAARAAPEAAPTAPATVDGFRSARRGMNIAEVEGAIQRDFGIPPAKVTTTENAAERTTILTIDVGNLLDGAGIARISYLFGYKSKALIQVTILWGTPVDPRIPAENIVTAANQLRQLFLDSGYEAKSIITNSRLADGSILVFEGQDTAKHMTVLHLSGTSTPAKESRDKGSIANISLSLSYILDSVNPDIFRLKKGQF